MEDSDDFKDHYLKVLQKKVSNVHSFLSDPSWKWLKEKDGAMVYSLKTSNSKFKYFRAELVMKDITPLEYLSFYTSKYLSVSSADTKYSSNKRADQIWQYKTNTDSESGLYSSTFHQSLRRR